MDWIKWEAMIFIHQWCPSDDLRLLSEPPSDFSKSPNYLYPPQQNPTEPSDRLSKLPVPQVTSLSPEQTSLSLRLLEYRNYISQPPTEVTNDLLWSKITFMIPFEPQWHTYGLQWHPTYPSYFPGQPSEVPQHQRHTTSGPYWPPLVQKERPSAPRIPPWAFK